MNKNSKTASSFVAFAAFVVLALSLPEAAHGNDGAALLEWFVGRNDGDAKYLFVHTTDIHGWIGQQRHNTKVDTDLGDFVSLLSHLRAAADEAGVNLFVADSGDLVFGTGLSDAGSVHGEYILPIIADVDYDALTAGNHDMDHDASLLWLQANFVPKVSNKYLTSNTIFNPEDDFLGTPYFVHDFPDGSRALVLGFIFHYPRASPDVTTVEIPESVLEEYFTQAMEEPDIDLVIVLGHIDPKNKHDLMAIFEPVHATHPDLPFIFLGGHRHVTYFGDIDPNAYAMESGRYLTTVGTISMTVDRDSGAISDISNEFVKASRANYASAAGIDESDLDTDAGNDIKERIADAEHELGLDVLLGCAPMTYSKYVDYAEENALWRLFFEDVVPEYVLDAGRDNPQIFMANFYSIRSELYEGEVLIDDVYSLLPFLDATQVYEDVPGSLVRYVYKGLRMNQPSKKSGFVTFRSNFPEEELDDDTLYDFAVQLYDSKTVGEYLERGGGEPWPRTEYPGPFNVHEAMRAFVEDHWEC